MNGFVVTVVRGAMTLAIKGRALGIVGAVSVFAAFAGQAHAETAAAFAERIVKLYGPHGLWTSPDDAEMNRVHREYYDPSFVALIDDNGALASQKAGGVDLDDDPVCGGCQDGPDKLRVMSIDQKGPDRADLHMTGPDCDAKPPECERYVIVIRRLSGRWAIYDVVDTNGSVRDMLTRHNLCLRRSHSEAEAGTCVD